MNRFNLFMEAVPEEPSLRRPTARQCEIEILSVDSAENNTRDAPSRGEDLKRMTVNSVIGLAGTIWLICTSVGRDASPEARRSLGRRRRGVCGPLGERFLPDPTVSPA